jgi:hypothetical protein
VSYRSCGRERLCSCQNESVKTEKLNVRNGSKTDITRECYSRRNEPDLRQRVLETFREHVYGECGRKSAIRGVAMWGDPSAEYDCNRVP